MKQFILLPQQRQQQRRMKFQLLLLLVLVSPNRQVRRPTIECLVAIVPRAEADFLELLQSSFSQPVVLSLSPFNAARGKSSTDDCTREGEGDGGRSEDDSSACQFREKADLRLTWQCRRSRLPLGFYLSAYMDHSLTPLLIHTHTHSHSLTHSLIHSLTLTPSLTHSLPYSLTYVFSSRLQQQEE